MALDTAGCDMPSRLAATRKLPASATAMNSVSLLRFIDARGLAPGTIRGDNQIKSHALKFHLVHGIATFTIMPTF
jgi:hypothetical protein